VVTGYWMLLISLR